MKKAFLFATALLLVFTNHGFCETQTCSNGGVLSGIGGDGQFYSEEFSGYGELEARVHPANDALYLFTLNGEPWPEESWAVTAKSWELVCNSDVVLETKTCNNGGVLSGIGGDGQFYSEEFSGYGELEARVHPANDALYLFTLNGEPWPEESWAVTAKSWELVCNETNCTQAELNEQYEAGKKYCIDNPEACGIDDRYDEGFQDGMLSCPENNCAILETNFDVTIPCLDVFGTKLPIELEKFTYPDDPFGYYWKLNLQ